MIDITGGYYFINILFLISGYSFVRECHTIALIKEIDEDNAERFQVYSWGCNKDGILNLSINSIIN